MLLSNLNLLATAPGGVAKLRELILTLAVQGKLVPQDPKDEPASELLKKIRAEKDRLIAEGKIRRDKPLAEIAEEEKPFELPQGWEWVRLVDVAFPQAGFAFKSNGFNEASQGLPLIRIRDVGDNDPQTFFSGDYREEFAVESGDWLISMDGEFRVREWLGPKALLNQRVTRLVFHGEDVFQPFVTAALQFKLSELQGTKAYTTVDHLSGGQIAASVIALPPLTEQSRIVTRVEELMRLCDVLEAKGQLEATQHAQLVSTLLGTLTESETPEELADNWQRVATHFDLLLDRPEAVDALEQTILQLAVRGLLVPQDPEDEPASELLKKIRAEKDGLIAEGKIKRDRPLAEISSDERPFEAPIGWGWVRLGDVVLISSGVTLGRKTAIPSPVSLPYVRVANVQRWHLNLSSMKEVVIDNSEIERFKLAGGDLLITEGGDWDKVGRTSIWRNELLTCLHQNHVFKARGTSTDWNPVWAELFLNSSIARTYFASSAKQTTNLASINMTQLKDCVFPIPPLSEQSRIVARVAHLRRMSTELRQRLTAANERQSQLAQSLVAVQPMTIVSTVPMSTFDSTKCIKR